MARKAQSTEPELPEIPPQVLEQLLGLADTDRMNFEHTWRSQDVADKNATDAVLIDKIEMLLVVLEHPEIDSVDAMPIKKKLMELVERL